ncbi:MAG TPA: helix-turn-helix domain-containing protein [Oculatellaceae cyanobacterium]
MTKSPQLRLLAVQKRQEGMKFKKIGQHLGMSASSAHRFVKHFKTTGLIEPVTERKQRKDASLTPAVLDAIEEILEESPEIQLQEIAQLLDERPDLDIDRLLSPSSISKAIKVLLLALLCHNAILIRFRSFRTWDILARSCKRWPSRNSKRRKTCIGQKSTNTTLDRITWSFLMRPLRIVGA